MSGYCLPSLNPDCALSRQLRAVCSLECVWCMHPLYTLSFETANCGLSLMCTVPFPAVRFVLPLSPSVSHSLPPLLPHPSSITPTPLSHCDSIFTLTCPLSLPLTLLSPPSLSPTSLLLPLSSPHSSPLSLDLFIRETDWLCVQAIAAGHLTQEVSKSAISFVL